MRYIGKMWATKMLMALALLLTWSSLTSTAIAQTDYDTAKEAYFAGQEAISKDEFREAEKTFQYIKSNWENSRYAVDALYWRAFALYRLDRTRDLHRAIDTLQLRAEDYPNAGLQKEARELETRVRGELARRGDAAEARKLTEHAKEDEDKNELKLATLHALMNMNSDKAVPILKRVLNDPSSDSTLREQAVFMLAEACEPEEAAEILLDVATNDPDPKVREQAIFWLSQVPGEESLAVLEQIVKNDEDAQLRERAVFALGEHESRRSTEVLKEVVLDKSQSDTVREQAVFWLGNKDGQENTRFLINLYSEIEEENLREMILLSVSESSYSGAGEWLLEIVSDTEETANIRKTALFWAGQNGQVSNKLLKNIYRDCDDRELKEQVLFVLAEQPNDDAVDLLIDIVRTEKDSDLRQYAIFWLGQTDDPRVEDLLLEIIME